MDSNPKFKHDEICNSVRVSAYGYLKIDNVYAKAVAGRGLNDSKTKRPVHRCNAK